MIARKNREIGENVIEEKKISKAIIKIKTYEKENNQIIEISDNAGGIAKEIIKNILAKFVIFLLPTRFPIVGIMSVAQY